MRKQLLPLLFLLCGVSAFSQDVYALTGKTASAIQFNDIRAFNVKNSAEQHVFFSAESSPEVYSQALNAKFKETRESIHQSQSPAMATLASNTEGDVFFMPMYSSNIYVMNPKTKAITLVENNVVKTTACDVSTHVTRMALGYDGAIYSLNNSGTQLIRIGKNGGKYIVEDLGAVTTNSSDPSIALSVMNAGFGGDMVADADNNLYVFAAFGNVFKLNIESRKAEFIGKISGLPQEYTINGAAVVQSGKVLLGSAKGSGYYEVNMETLVAVDTELGKGLPVYDLASKYFVNDKRLAIQNPLEAADIYPTVVSDKFFNVKTKVKNYSVEVYDRSGTRVLSKKMNATENTTRVDFSEIPQGVYFVNVKDETGKVLLTKKIIVNQ